MTEKSETDKAVEQEFTDKKVDETQEETATETTATKESAQTEESGGTQEDWKALARKWEDRSKQNFQQVETLTTEVKELQDQINDANNKLALTELGVVRWKVAAKHGVSEDDVELFLTGSDEDTLNKQAERLSQTSHRAPKPDAAQGNRSGQAEGLSPNQQGAAAMASLFD